jgi:four helix bundle protein
MSQRITTFKELRVYQQSCELDLAVFCETKRFPREEAYSLTDQVRRSSRGIGANISEAWAKRRYLAHFISKLTDADAELQETRHWLSRAFAYGYISDPAFNDFEARCDRVGSMLGRMLQNPEDFT